jgi:predicted NBD/HSP70 family sugar kinase
VLLGGYLAPLSDWLRIPIEAELEGRALAARRSRCRVVPARLGGEAVVRGAAALSRRIALDEAASALPDQVR